MTSLPAPGTVLDDKYEIESKLGQGGMAAVFRARHRYTHRVVAIKILLPSMARDPSVVERFLREARAATALDHPAAVAVLDVGRSAGGYYLVMEHLEGETLRARLERGTLTVTDALAILEPLLGAVAAAHARGIIHRDIKPDNVFLKRLEDGTIAPKLLDFGISKLTREEALTLTGAVMGTPEYLAPEQILDSSRVGPRADVYQLGVLFFEMLTGTTPLRRASYEAQLTAILTDEPLRLRQARPELPAELEAIVARTLRRSPEERTADVASLAAELRAYSDARRAEAASAPTMLVASAPPPARSVHPTPAPTPRSAWMMAALATALVVVLASAIGGALWWRARAPAAATSSTPAITRPVAIDAAPTTEPSP
ncbi:MAG: serine/threonine protein kinase, partial [Sandaracinaceae bacterium]|nr:serine/threonine protein kinase [Sandaracinaceae bacterium]